MTLKVIDISSHQNVNAASEPGVDAVIVKTTEGTGYINPKADQQYQLAKKNGRLLGVYHYASGGDPVKEADYFLKHSEGYIHEAILCLDWEAGGNASWGDKNWCRKFVDRVHEKTGVWCLIYVQASALAQVANLKDDCGLWIAGYPLNNANWTVPDFIYSTAPWPTYTIWQFTSGGGLDRNIANLTKDAWKKIAKGSGKTETDKPKPTEPSKPAEVVKPDGKALATIVSEVKAGKYGNGDARKKALGKYYTGVQAIIDNNNVTATLVKETLAGKYGNGDARKKTLGTYYASVQKQIDAQATKTYTVKNGDTLSGIGAKLGVNWLNLANSNGIKPPYLIKPGQTIKY